MYAPASTPLVYAIHHIIVVMAVSCKGKAVSLVVLQDDLLCVLFLTKVARRRCVPPPTLGWASPCEDFVTGGADTAVKAVRVKG